MNFKSFLLSSLIVTTGLVASAPGAKAAECFNGNGYRVCMESLGMNRWEVSFENNHGSEFMEVQCIGKSVSDWKSRGDLNQSEAQYLAEEFCSW